MASIKIIANGLEIDYVRETLSVKKENTALSRNFKISHSSVPFLVIDNSNTNKAIGTREMTSIKKNKVVDVVVFDAGQKFYGQLQIISYLNGFRKCNLKYASALLSIMDIKIADLMPVVSVIPGEQNPVPFVDKNDSVITGFTNWSSYARNFITQGFPSVKWNFPTMQWTAKFGDVLEEDDEWAGFTNEVNVFDESGNYFKNNSYTEDQFEITSVINQNVPMPQIYLLSPLFYALQSIGFTAEGTFWTSSFIKRILFLSFKNNLTEILLSKKKEPIIFTGPPTEFNFFAIKTQQFTRAIVIPAAGTYVVNYDFTFNGPEPSYSYGRYALKFMVGNSFPGHTIFTLKSVEQTTITESGSKEIEISKPTTLFLIYQSKEGDLPVSYNLSLSKGSEKTFYEMHPTIELGRYLPDWTFATYLNALQNMFNVEIIPDDLRKRLTLDLYEEKISSGPNYKLSKSLIIPSFDEPTYDAFLLKYENDEDNALYITKNGIAPYVNQKSDYLETLDTKFKFIPNDYTAVLTDDLESKNGTGLIIYNHDSAPFTADEFSGQTLTIDGPKGICEYFWKKTLKFRLHGSVVELEGPLTEVEINNIVRLNRIYVDNQEYIVNYLEQRETTTGDFIVTLNAQTVTF